MQPKNKRPFKVIGAYDSETTNYIQGLTKAAFPIVHQIGLIDIKIEKITAENVEDNTRIYIFRHTVELYEFLDKLSARKLGFVPVLVCHNLAFDMYGLASWLQTKNIKVLAKSQRKPISFSVLDDDDEPLFVIWDTLIFSQKSLDFMGRECGYKKLKGAWDYDLARTPETPLTDEERAYATHDIYALLSWLGYWCRLNPDINPAELGHRVVSKTGIVRRRRLLRFGNVKGKGRQKTVSQYWQMLNSLNTFKSDDELFTCNAATRGGFTFCARKNANVVFDFNERDKCAIYGFDATSQHPAQIVSHLYPVEFRESTPSNLTAAFRIIAARTLDEVLERWAKPFNVAFYGCFEFVNLRLKKGSLFEKYGIAPLASARCKNYKKDDFLILENQNGEEFREHMASIGYKDEVQSGIFAFGKLESAHIARLYLTELAAWEIVQAYDFDEVKAISGYITLKFAKPSDMAIVSVMQFYKAKNEFKCARENFYKNQKIENAELLKQLGVPSFVVDGMCEHTIADSVVESSYLSLKADLNALFGIEACNEYRRDTVLGAEGISYVGDFGITNAPKNPKAFYQFGQRIVGWSRVAQLVVMQLCAPHIDSIVNGDTDSIKFLIKDANLKQTEKALNIYNQALTKAKIKVCERAQLSYPSMFSSLEGIGAYILEFKTYQFCAAWNKAYLIREKDKRDNLEHCHFTLAGLPAASINALADDLMQQGWAFGDICDRFLGFNVTFAYDSTNLHARTFPEWGATFCARVKDYQGCESLVAEPAALCLYPMAKTTNDTANAENAQNLKHARKNRPSVKSTPCIITKNKIYEQEELLK